MRFATLHRAGLPAKPMEAVRAWVEAARAAGVDQASSCCLATVGAHGFPDSRMVVARVVDADGVVFCSHRDSAKATQLQARPAAALTFFWPSLMQQLRLRGPVGVAGDEVSEKLWSGLSRASRAAAIASDQATSVPDRAALDRVFDAAMERVDEHTTRPPTWVAYRLRPTSVELWQGHPEDRRHDRFRYERSGGSWKIRRLMP